MITETIEDTIPFFQRHQEKWRKPLGFGTRLKLVLTNPGKVMWDLTHKPSAGGGTFIFFMNCLIFGLVGLVLFAKMDTTNLKLGLDPYSNFPGYQTLHAFSIYLLFVLNGIIFFGMLYLFIIIAQTIGAKYVLNIIPKWKKQGNVLTWAFFPSIIATGVYVAILAIGLPISDPLPPIDILGDFTMYDPLANESVYQSLFTSGQALITWQIAEVVQISFYFGYLSLLLAIGYREYYDKSTTKALVSTLLTGGICAVIYVFTRSVFPIPIF